MKKAVAAVVLGLCLTGCWLTEERKAELRAEAHACIIAHMESEGKAKAEELVDTLLAEGKIGSVAAEKIKAAIPEGIEGVKKVMGEIENE